MAKPLNILLLQGEDVGRHLGCYGDSFACTPNLDRLATEGTVFTHAFSNAPVCAPSRGGMVTGCYPWSIGNHHMRSTLVIPPRCFTHELREAGYHVAWPTKLDFNFEPSEGWCDNQEQWFDKAPPKEPFFLYENFSETHESRMFRELPDWTANDNFDFPDQYLHDAAHAPVPPYLPNIPELREQLVKYYNAFTAIDHEIGKRLRWLDENGLRKNTIVIFLSDHGRGLPREKRWCYDAGIHLPLIIRWPEQLEAGSASDEIVSWVDIAPTLLSLAGVPVPGHYQGKVFLGADKSPPREFAFAGRDRMDKVFDKVRLARDRKWLYIRNDAPGLPYAQKQWYMEQQPVMPVMREMHAEGKLSGDEAVFFQKKKPVEELYNVEKDPHQLNNLAADPAHKNRLIRMASALEENLTRFGDMGETDEKTLVERCVVTDRYKEYLELPDDLPPEMLIGPMPIPMTLDEARPWLLNNP